MMASLAFDSAFGAHAPSTERNGKVEIEQALAAVQRLVGADGIDLLGYHHDTETVTTIASTAQNKGMIATPAVRAAVKAETAFLLGQNAPRWLDDANDRGGARLLLKLASRPSDVLFLLVSLADTTAVARARVMRLVPDLMVLIAYHVSLDTHVRESEEFRTAAIEAEVAVTPGRASP